MREKYGKASVVAIIFMVSIFFVGYGILISSAAEPSTEKSPITVGILDPDYGDTISGKIMIRALIYHSRPDYQTNPIFGYAVSVLLTEVGTEVGTEIGTSVPLEWDSSSVEDGLWNITVLVTDSKGNAGKDEVLITTMNYAEPEPNMIMVGILTPRHAEVVSGDIWIDAMIFQSIPSMDYEVSVLLDGTEIGTSLPLEWDSTSVEDDLWTIAVLVTDSEGNMGSDEVTIYVLNNPSPTPSTPRARVYVIEDYLIDMPFDRWQKIDFEGEYYDTTGSFDLLYDWYTIPEDGYYLFTASITFLVGAAPGYLAVRVGDFAWSALGGSFHPVEVVTISVTDIVYFYGGQSIEVEVYVQGPYYIAGGYSGRSVFSITKLGD